MLLAPSDPLAPIEDWGPTIMLFAERAFESAESSVLVHFEAKIDVYLMDNVAVTTEVRTRALARRVKLECLRKHPVHPEKLLKLCLVSSER